MNPHPFPPRSFNTSRLTLRAPDPRFAKVHLNAVLESRDELRCWMPWARDEPSFETTSKELSESAAKFTAGTDYRLLLFLKDSETLIGGSGLHRPNWDGPTFEIGYWVRKSFAKQGYITEAVRGIMEMAFYKLGAQRLEIRTSTINAPSIAVARRAGFTLEGVLHQDGRHLDRTPRDTMVFAKVRPAFSVAGSDPIRPMTAADVASVLALWKQTNLAGPTESLEAESLLHNLERFPGFSFVLVNATSNVMGAILASHDGMQGTIIHLAVTPTHQRQGFGRTLVARSMQALKTSGIKSCRLMMNGMDQAASAFWAKLGWTPRSDVHVLQCPIE